MGIEGRGGGGGEVPRIKRREISLRGQTVSPAHS